MVRAIRRSTDPGTSLRSVVTMVALFDASEGACALDVKLVEEFARLWLPRLWRFLPGCVEGLFRHRPDVTSRRDSSFRSHYSAARCRSNSRAVFTLACSGAAAARSAAVHRRV